jgi:hypothetical protein
LQKTRTENASNSTRARACERGVGEGGGIDPLGSAAIGHGDRLARDEVRAPATHGVASPALTLGRSDRGPVPLQLVLESTDISLSPGAPKALPPGLTSSSAWSTGCGSMVNSRSTKRAECRGQRNRQQQIVVRKKQSPTWSSDHPRLADAICEVVSTNVVGSVQWILHRVLQF